jgi:hypothetical protein
MCIPQVSRLALALLTAGVCASAHAVVPDTITPVPNVQVGVPASFAGYASGTSFWDIFTFILPANGGSGYSVVDFPLTIGQGTFATTFTSVTLFSDPDGIPNSGNETALITANITNPSGPISLSWGPTSGGNMYLSVFGNTTGSLGGLYSGAINVSPVPEAETWAMMAAGLGLVGMQLRRRTRGGRLMTS